MKNQFLKVTFINIVLAVCCMMNAANAAHISLPTGGFGVSSNFIDNGVITTEYRADDTVWEWLDLTVTNGISYNSIVADLLNDGSLNNSGSVLNASAGALSDVDALSTTDALGWSTVSIVDVTHMYNTFFGFPSGELPIFEVHSYGGNVSIVEEFILLYGDTHHDGLFESSIPFPDVNPSLLNIGYSSGFSSNEAYIPTANIHAGVIDGQYYGYADDHQDDAVYIDGIGRNYTPVDVFGTYLIREVTALGGGEYYRSPRAIFNYNF
jgi:hypothetical protein